ncbi:hypothetical protein OB905_13150 [Halobacteria archaeon AArc-dxtr1]|nr:hypothetical protein [Halobacteria archaeon AArc-dxtr1]
MLDQLKHNANRGWEMGREDGFSGVTRAAGLADGAFTLLFVLIILAVAALVGGEFLDAIEVPTEDPTPIEESIGDIESNASTAFVLFGVGILVIPAAAVVGYLWTQMGGMIGGGLQRMR